MGLTCKLRKDGTVKTDEEFWNEIENAYIKGYLNASYGMYGEKHLTDEQIMMYELTRTEFIKETK